MVHGVFASNFVLGGICSEAACLPLFFLKPQPTKISEKKMSGFIIYIIYDTKMRPSFITSTKTLEKFSFFFKLCIHISIYLYIIYTMYAIYRYTSLSRCSGLIRLGAHCPARRTVGDGVTWQHCWWFRNPKITTERMYETLVNSELNYQPHWTISSMLVTLQSEIIQCWYSMIHVDIVSFL